MEEEEIAYTCLHTHTQDANLINLQTEKEHKHMTVSCYNKSTVPKICIEFSGKEEREKNVVMNTKPNTNHAELATLVERQVEKKAYTHDTDSLKQANRQGICVRETKAIIGRVPRLGIPTPVRQTPSRVCAQTFSLYAQCEDVRIGRSFACRALMRTAFEMLT